MKSSKEIAGGICLFLIIWVVVAEIVFAVRHPWATDTERLLRIVDAMAFRKVPYNEMRPRDE